MNKLVLFMKDGSIPPTFSAVSATFKDRMRFFSVHFGAKGDGPFTMAKSRMKSLKKAFGISEYPDVILIRSRSAKQDEVKYPPDSSSMVRFAGDIESYFSLQEFVAPYVSKHAMDPPLLLELVHEEQRLIVTESNPGQ